MVEFDVMEFDIEDCLGYICYDVERISGLLAVLREEAFEKPGCVTAIPHYVRAEAVLNACEQLIRETQTKLNDIIKNKI